MWKTELVVGRPCDTVSILLSPTTCTAVNCGMEPFNVLVLYMYTRLEMLPRCNECKYGTCICEPAHVRRHHESSRDVLIDRFLLRQYFSGAKYWSMQENTDPLVYFWSIKTDEITSITEAARVQS